MKEVRLTNSTLKAIVDDEDYRRVSKHRWCLNNGGYAITGIKQFGQYHTWNMSEVVLGYIRGKEIDHINRTPLDNRKANLRHVDRGQNVKG